MRKIEITRTEAEMLVDLLEGEDPATINTNMSRRRQLASEIREEFGMSPRDPIIDVNPKPLELCQPQT